MTELRYEVLVSDGIPRNRNQRLPDGGPIVSSPLSTTLIYGERDTVLVDAPFTRDQVRLVGDWVERSGKRLTHIYATHGHGDHWFGTDLLMRRFPDAVPYATEGTIRLMHSQALDGRAALWDRGLSRPDPRQPGGVPAGPRRRLRTGGQPHVPSIGLIVAGDVAYNGVHQYLLEAACGGRRPWLAALELVADLKPRAVAAGHKNKHLPDDPAILGQTRDYLLDAQRLLADNPSPRAFYDQMLARHPDRLNLGPLWYGALGLLGSSPPDAGRPTM